MNIGIVGLGRMGSAMAERLRQQGFEVVGWDHNPVVNETLAAGGLRVAANSQGVAAVSEIVISSITEDHGVRRIFSGPGGFFDTDVKGKLFIEMSTLQPMTGRELALLVEAKGARLIEAPVLGTIPQVRNGTLLALVGGSRGSRARPSGARKDDAPYRPYGAERHWLCDEACGQSRARWLCSGGGGIACAWRSSKASRSIRCSTCCKRRPMPAVG